MRPQTIEINLSELRDAVFEYVKNLSGFEPSTVIVVSDYNEKALLVIPQDKARAINGAEFRQVGN